MEDIMKIATFLKERGILIKCITKTIEIETKKERDKFLSMLFGALGTTLL